MASKSPAKAMAYAEILHSLPGEEKVKALINFSKEQELDDDSRTFMKSLLPWVTFHSSTMTPNPTVTYAFDVQPEHHNSLHSMHGGATATLFDWCTSISLGLINKPGFWFFTGVSRNLSLTYLKPVPVGEKVLVECEIVSAGKKLCHLKGRMKRASDGVVLATCEHDKVSFDPPSKGSKL